MQHHDWLAILDFGSQYTHLIARRVRECGVYSEVVRFDADQEGLEDGTGAVILSGGPSSIYADDSPRPSRKIFGLGVPVLGICYGLHAMTEALGGTVERSETRSPKINRLYSPRPGATTVLWREYVRKKPR